MCLQLNTNIICHFLTTLCTAYGKWNQHARFLDRSCLPRCKGLLCSCTARLQRRTWSGEGEAQPNPTSFRSVRKYPLPCSVILLKQHLKVLLASICWVAISSYLCSNILLGILHMWFLIFTTSYQGSHYTHSIEGQKLKLGQAGVVLIHTANRWQNWNFSPFSFSNHKYLLFQPVSRFCRLSLVFPLDLSVQFPLCHLAVLLGERPPSAAHLCPSRERHLSQNQDFSSTLSAFPAFLKCPCLSAPTRSQTKVTWEAALPPTCSIYKLRHQQWECRSSPRTGGRENGICEKLIIALEDEAFFIFCGLFLIWAKDSPSISLIFAVTLTVPMLVLLGDLSGPVTQWLSWAGSDRGGGGVWRLYVSWITCLSLV